MTDMIRASIDGFDDISDLISAYEKLCELNPSMFRIIRIKDKLKSHLKQISINFVYGNYIIGELQMNLGSVSPLQPTYHFLYEL